MQRIPTRCGSLGKLLEVAISWVYLFNYEAVNLLTSRTFRLRAVGFSCSRMLSLTHLAKNKDLVQVASLLHRISKR